MIITRLIAINNTRSHTSKKILLERFYQGDREDFVYEFLNELNDELYLELSQNEIGRLFVNLGINSNVNIIKDTQSGKIDIYIDYKIEEI